jgi:hypothetical protein
MRSQRVEVGVLLHVGGVLVALADGLAQRGQSAVRVDVGPFFALGRSELRVAFGQRHTEGKDAGGVVEVTCWIELGRFGGGDDSIIVEGSETVVVSWE